MSSRLEFTVTRAGVRLDKYIAEEYPELSRTRIQKLISEGFITVNDRVAKGSLKLNIGDKITAIIPPPVSITPLPEKIPLTIVYEDNDLLVVDKPAGLAVHPAPGHPSHTLVNAILAHCPDLALTSRGGSVRPGIVHRLDKNTSGLMVVAKNDASHQNLSNQIKARSVVKRYLVLVQGHLSPERGIIEAPIGRDPGNRKRMAVVSEGREARTQYRVIRYLDSYTLLEVTLETGRTHQIRVHLSAIGFPVVGDEVYGRRSPYLGRQFVHACHLGFRLPSSGEYVEFRSKLPPDLEQALEHISLL
ncbi:MAG: RluA family pseudouridine synthase [Dehalococcoidia bacterium]|nr:RluA family pseudouridine synthase [Dehalococcoidia bacterium]